MEASEWACDGGISCPMSGNDATLVGREKQELLGARGEGRSWVLGVLPNERDKKGGLSGRWACERVWRRFR